MSLHPQFEDLLARIQSFPRSIERSTVHDTPPRRKWRVRVASRASLLECYDGHVDVWSSDSDPDMLFKLAVEKLRRTSFPERLPDSWRLLGITMIID